MFAQIIVLSVLSIVIGYGIKSFLKFKASPIQLEHKNVLIASAISIGLISLLLVGAWSFIKADKLSFNEYWNGYETQAVWDKENCSRDSGCSFTFNCDPYLQAHYTTTTDSKGNVTTSVYYTTEYHHCPYTKEEWNFVVKTTLGDYQIDHTLPDNAESLRYRNDESIPASIHRGIPGFWAQAKARLDSGKPGPVTKRMSYDNYILASDSTILNKYSDKIQEFLAHGILPKVSNTIRDFYYANKAYLIGYQPATDWQAPLSYLDAALGTELQGDLHLVITQNAEINRQPDAYITALKAYWTDPKVFGHDTISKNSIIVVIGTQDGATVSWARAVTGMPLGNEYMLTQIQSRLQGVILDPSTVIGSVNGQLYTNNNKVKAKVVHETGILDKVLWGLDDTKSKFQRISMTANDTGDVGSGFKYLSDEIQPSQTQQLVVDFFALLLIGILWTITVWVNSEGSSDSGYKYRGFYR